MQSVPADKMAAEGIAQPPTDQYYHYHQPNNSSATNQQQINKLYNNTQRNRGELPAIR